MIIPLYNTLNVIAVRRVYSGTLVIGNASAEAQISAAKADSLRTNVRSQSRVRVFADESPLRPSYIGSVGSGMLAYIA